MKRRSLLFIAILFALSLALTACEPSVIGEKRAKIAGLGMINLTFDTQAKEAEAEVALEERPGLSYINGIEAHLGDEDPIYFYTVKVGRQEDGNYRYYAEVNAVTGMAYRVDRNPSTIVLTAEQQSRADALGTLDDFSPLDFSEVELDAREQAEHWVRDKLEPDVPILRIIPNNIGSDSVDFPLVRMDCYVIFVDGEIYNIEVCWPTMEVIGVYLLNRDS